MRYIYLLGSSQLFDGFVSTLQERWTAGSAAQKEAISSQGYWPLTKALVNRILDEEVLVNDKIYFTGHSQGGMMAALSSMYVEKSRGEKIQTVTFAALGGSCAARSLGWPRDANLLDDVDPYVHHQQITDYADVYDCTSRARAPLERLRGSRAPLRRPARARISRTASP
jgi:hypothetical protein